MPVAIAAGVIGLIVVLVAFYRDAPLAERRVVQPDWDLLPDPSDVARTEFPLAFPGYEPATVEFHFDRLNRAYGDLLASATPEVIARARHRAAVRAGVELPDGADQHVAEPPAPRISRTAVGRPAQRSTLAPLSAEGADAEALRAEAALADLEGSPGGADRPH